MRYDNHHNWRDNDEFLTPRGVFPPVFRKTLARSVRQLVLTLLGCLLLLTTLAAAGTREPACRAGRNAGLEPQPAGLFLLSPGVPSPLFEAPLLKSEVTIDVSGLVQRVTVSQHFFNPSESWLEGLYVFPLPEKSAVDRLTLEVGDRRIEGDIMEKADAKKAYEAAAKAGKSASLLSAHRPNVFSTAVANVGPGETVAVEIEYQDAVDYDAGLFSLRFPMVVAPRYSPPEPLLAEAPAERPEATSVAPTGGHPLRIRPLRPRASSRRRTDQPLELSVRLNAGMPLQSLASPYHDISIESDAEGRQHVSLQSGKVPANRDFLLEWRPQASTQPEAALFVEEVDGSSHLMVMLLPPTQAADDQDLTDMGEWQTPESRQPRDMNLHHRFFGVHARRVHRCTGQRGRACGPGSACSPGDRFKYRAFQRRRPRPLRQSRHGR